MSITAESILKEENDILNGRFLTFAIDREMYGIEIRYVTEIIGLQTITVMPEMPDYMKGIVNLRGRIIPVMDVRLCFKMPGKEYTDTTCIIVIQLDDVSIGLIVDCISEVIKIQEADILDVPDISTRCNRGYVKNIGKQGGNIIQLLNCEKLLIEKEFETISERI